MTETTRGQFLPDAEAACQREQQDASMALSTIMASVLLLVNSAAMSFVPSQICRQLTEKAVHIYHRTKPRIKQCSNAVVPAAMLLKVQCGSEALQRTRALAEMTVCRPRRRPRTVFPRSTPEPSEKQPQPVFPIYLETMCYVFYLSLCSPVLQRCYI